MGHLNSNNILPKGQHGFLSGRSTIMAVTEIVEHIANELEAGNIVNRAILDLSKKSDSKAPTDLEQTRNLFHWKSCKIVDLYLTSVEDQMVEIKYTEKGKTRTVRSGLLDVTREVSWGSVLGPVIFAMFAADLPYYMAIYSYTVMF